MHAHKALELTFDPPFSVPAPRDNLVHNLALAVDDEHRQPRVGQVGDALVAHDRHELGVRVPLGEDADVLCRAVAPLESFRFHAREAQSTG